MIPLDATGKLQLYALIWAGLLLFALARGAGRLGTVGLPLAFVASYLSGHAGALVYLVDGYDHTANAYLQAMNYTRDTVAEGFEASCFAMGAATAGFAMAEFWTRIRKGLASPMPLSFLRSVSRGFMVAGMGAIILGVILARTGFSLPGLQAIITAFQNLFIVGACGWVLYHYLLGGTRSAMFWAGTLAVATPAIYLVLTAILADSIVLAILITCFYLALPAPRLKGFSRKLLLLTAAICCAFVFAVFYLQARAALRDVVWGGGGVDEAIGSITKSAKGFEIAATTDSDALFMVDARLNQNVFVGLAIDNLRARPYAYENGATVMLALFAWVPRIIWQNKPERGGSTFLAKHTGLPFAEGTTFGAGPIFEFYVNFGYAGVFLGFLLFGIFIRALDIAAFKALVGADLGAFAQYLLAGMAMLQPLADLFFVVTNMATALLLGWGVRALLSKRLNSLSARDMRYRG